MTRADSLDVCRRHLDRSFVCHSSGGNLPTPFATAVRDSATIPPPAESVAPSSISSAHIQQSNPPLPTSQSHLHTEPWLLHPTMTMTPSTCSKPWPKPNKGSRKVASPSGLCWSSQKQTGPGGCSGEATIEGCRRALPSCTVRRTAWRTLDGCLLLCIGGVLCTRRCRLVRCVVGRCCCLGFHGWWWGRIIR